MATYEFVRQVDAIDYSGASIAKADEHYPHEKVRRWVADMKEMSSHAKYDLVVSLQVFEHVSDPDLFLARGAGRNPGARDGHVAIFTLNCSRLSNIRRWLKFEKSLLLDPQHFKEYTAAEVVALGRRHGLKYAHSFGYGMHGMTLIDRMPVEKRTRLGQFLPYSPPIGSASS